ncbi:MAG: hypothetical protein HYS13_03685 [Planctomycetia bacterium]|nr:hypothetical protein [Planctomycetia bacterium]
MEQACGSRGRLRRAVLAALAPVVCCLSSCGGSDRLPVFPVTGELFVDGQPAFEAFVYLHAVKEDSEHLMQPYGQVDKDGKFAIATYVSGDGAPPGEYILTIEWLTFQPFGNQWGGPDKLGDKYSDPTKSELRVTVKEEATQIPRISLTK